MKRRGVYVALAIAGGVALLVILILDIDGWGTFCLDVGKSCAAQAVIASFLFGVLMIPLLLLRNGFGLSLSLPIMLVAFVVAAAAALPVLPRLFQRPVDVYDIGQTIALCVAFYFVARRIERRVKRSSPRPLSAPPDSPTRPVMRRTPPSSRRTVSTGGSVPTRSRSAGYQSLYQNLLRKVGGDHRTVARLIEYERRRKPNASDRELFENAIWRWENDNR
jgi:hypothetical protein